MFFPAQKAGRQGSGVLGAGRLAEPLGQQRPAGPLPVVRSPEASVSSPFLSVSLMSSVHLLALLGELNEIIYVESFSWCLAHIRA